MKILIAEDDLVTREILKRLLANMATEILEAGNGVEALELIEREDPDLLFTDLQMPMLDGLAVVEAVRGSARHARLPIVCMSAVKNKDEITRLVNLGIADYILKPLRATEVHERLQRVISQHAGWRHAAGDGGKPTLLLVEGDTSFRQFVIPLVEGDYAVIEATSGAHALRAYQEAESKPGALLIAEGLTLVSETQLVSVVSRLAIEAHTLIPSFWLLTDAEEVPPEKARHFSGVMRRTFVAEQCTAELRRTLLSGTARPVSQP